jgi:hypothetical protein
MYENIGKNKRINSTQNASNEPNIVYPQKKLSK